MEHLIEYKEMREAIARVRELHKPSDFYGNLKCSQCTWGRDESPEDYPCPTIKALDGEQYICTCLELTDPMGFHSHNCMRKNAGLPEFDGEQ